MNLQDEEISRLLSVDPYPLIALIDKYANLKTREGALTLLNGCIEADCDILFTKLTRIAIGPGEDHGTASSVLREFLTNGKITYWGELTVESQNKIRSDLLLGVQFEVRKSRMVALYSLVSDIALNSIKPVNGQKSDRIWSELMMLMLECLDSNSQIHQKFALAILERATEFVRVAIYSHHEHNMLQQRLHDSLSNLLVSPTSDLRTSAFKGLRKLLDVDRERFNALLPKS